MKATQSRRHAAINVYQSPSSEQPLRRLVEHDIVASIKTLPFQTPCQPQAIRNGHFSIRSLGPDKYGLIPARRDCEQRSDLHAERATSDNPTGRKRRRSLSPLSSLDHVKMPRVKVIRQQKARAKQATYIQYMEDLLEFVLRWEAPKKQTSGNEARSGLVGDKQQTMQALCILTEVLVRRTVSPLEPRPGETPLQTVVREARIQIEAHLNDDSADILPSCSLMADHSLLGDQRCRSFSSQARSWVFERLHYSIVA
jgi:hypothetical protein